MSLSGEKYELRAPPETFQYFGRSGTNLAVTYCGEHRREPGFGGVYQSDEVENGHASL